MKRNLNLVKTLLLLLLVACASVSRAQVTVSASNTIDCSHPSTTLTANLIGDVPIDPGLTLDDEWSAPVNIGFTFNFYGTPYTQCLVGDNGNINFDLTLAGLHDDYDITAALAGNPSALNMICGPWCDMYIPEGGTITYSTDGVAPFRKFVVKWCDVQMFTTGFCPGQKTTTQVIMYETTNIIEVHTARKNICTGVDKRPRDLWRAKCHRHLVNRCSRS
jgi:fluoride ion exporter CrcB/FEX